MKPNTLQPPSWLSSEAQAIFSKTAEALGAQAMDSDSSVIAEYAQAQADCEQWAAEVRFEGEVIIGATGNPYTNPRYTNLQARRKELDRYRDLLGMSPKSRKVVVKSTPKGGLADRMGR